MCCRGPSGCARINRNATGRPVNTRLEPIRRVLIARLRVLRRRLPNIWRPEADDGNRAPAVPDKPSGVRQAHGREGCGIGLSYHLSGAM
jgi:hypothetical protein